MHTRSSSKLSRDQTSNPTSSTNPTPKGRIRKSLKQKVEISNFEENPLPPEVPMAENQTMTQLLQAPTDGYEDAIVIPEIATTNFELKHGLINLIQNKQFFGHEKEDPHAHLRYFNKITSTMRFFPPSKTTNLRNEIMRFQQRFDELFSKAWDRFNDLLRACPHHGFSELHQLDTFYNALNINDQDSLNSTAGGNFLDKMPADCLKIIESKLKVRQTRAKAVVAKVNSNSSTPAISSDVAELKDMGQSTQNQCQSTRNQLQTVQNQLANLTDMMSKFMSANTATSSGSGTLPAPVQPTVTQSESETLVSEPVVTPVSAPMPNLKPSIPYPSRRDNERGRDQAIERIEKFYEIFKEISFEISFTDALMLMPKFASTLKALIGNKEKLSEMARTPMNEHRLAVILNKLAKKLGDPGKFLIPCEFPGMNECLALADLGASVNLMPLFVWKGLSLPELTLTCMTFELADRMESKPVGIARDVKVKVGVFHFPADFVVVDFEPNPRVPLILERCFLKSSRALIDVHKGKLTLRFGHEAITYNLDQTSRYSANYDQMTTNKIDVTDEACEEYSQEVLGFSDVTASGSPTPSDDPIVSTTFPTLTPFGDSDFLLFEEADAFLGLEDDPDSPELDPSYYDLEGDILLLEAILNSDPSPPLSNHKQSVPSFTEELNACEAKTIKSSIDEPPEVELKDLPHHLEYVFLEGDNKLPVIIAKELRDEEKSALIKVLMSHKPVIAWKLSDIHEAPILNAPNWDLPFELMCDASDFAIEAPILNAPNWDLPFELMCDASDFAIGAVLGQRHEKHFRPIHYASKTLTDAGSNYTTTEKEMLAVVYAFKKFQSYLIMNKCIVHTDHSALKNLFAKKDAKARLLRWVLLLQEFDFAIIDTKGAEKLAADHLSRLENPYENVLDPKEINENFPLETLGMVTSCGDSGASWFADFANYHNSIQICEIFDVWGIDFMGSFPSSRGNKYILVAVDYLSKWVEAKALPNNDARVVCKFLKSLFARSGAPRDIISDHGTHFCNDQFKKVMRKYGVTHRLSTAYHPQTSRQVEVTNYGLKRIIERTIGQNCASWSDKLDDALWAFRTTYKTPIGCTPYKLVYGKACHLSIELEHKAYWALKQTNFDLSVAGDHRKIQLNELNELRDHAYENSLIYKEKTKRIHDSKIKHRVFNVDDQVLLFNLRLKIFSGKLKSHWIGPFTIAKVFPYGTVELSQANGPNFKVNGHRIKHYFGGDVP
uniref:Reverse transcriptase domain-containing protein n=1 Tax=Tanacetum cinerariifolium TaxID=118510 RepID=A0A699H8E6_TANCI|nr:reverse transcriptase domain-containing protein [Tanacetum cinerariifolium]